MNKSLKPDVNRDIQYIGDNCYLVPVIDEVGEPFELIMNEDDAEQFIAEQILILTDDCKEKMN